MVTALDRAAALCGAGAFAVWPTARNAASRTRALLPRPTIAVRPRARTLRRGRLLALVLLPVVPLLGFAGSIAACLLFTAGWCHRRVSLRAKAETADAQAMAEAIRVMVAELRAGAPTASAAESAAADASGKAATTMTMLAATARLGGDFLGGDSPGGGPRSTDPDRRALAMAWSLSRRYGLPLAELLDAVRRDIVATARFAAKANASMAGARAGAAVLAGLPSFGLLLGEAMGAAPLQVLLGTSAGQASLVSGAALILAGVAWSGRLTSRGALR
jgi:tight adherence protein B